MNVRKTNIGYTANKWSLKSENNTTRKTDSETIIIKIMVSDSIPQISSYKTKTQHNNNTAASH